MKDEDIIKKVAKLFGVTYNIIKASDKNPKWNDLYGTMVRGKNAIKLMVKLKPLMGIRRQQQIQCALDSYNPNAYILKLSKEDVYKIKEMLYRGMTHNKIAKTYSVSRATITDINIGKTWKDIKYPLNS